MLPEHQKSFSERLIVARETHQLKKAQVARMARLHRSYLGKLESGESLNPSSDVIAALCQALGVRREWLENGEGDMLPSEATHATVEETPTNHTASLCTISDLEIRLQALVKLLADFRHGQERVVILQVIRRTSAQLEAMETGAPFKGEEGQPGSGA